MGVDRREEMWYNIRADKLNRKIPDYLWLQIGYKKFQNAFTSINGLTVRFVGCQKDARYRFDTEIRRLYNMTKAEKITDVITFIRAVMNLL